MLLKRVHVTDDGCYNMYQRKNHFWLNSSYEPTLQTFLTIQKEYIHYARLKGQCARKYEESSEAYACIFMKRVTKLGEKLCCAATKIDALVELL